ncbi:MAG: valine--tRNA ligase [Candidatus Aenigmarchaeota archaeon]|nr:valine--tRNA ligase [Candidatus Aenigmarchaeota archaeon]
MDKNYDPKIAEEKWQEQWNREGVYRFDPQSAKPLFSIDTPPPTVSGSMHIGHAFSYSQMDFIARYHRMKGENVFMPFGTDDNGLATERLIEKLNNVRSKKMDRGKFIELCLATLEKIRPDFVADWKRMGISADWTIFYSTINDHCRKISQQSFIELYNKGLEYRVKAPFMWCPQCQTAIAQVELKDVEKESKLVYIKLDVEGSNQISIATTRPELFGSAAAIYVNPEDKRYTKLIGKKATIPIYNRNIPIMANEEADMEYGTGAVYQSTFGDMTDADWAKKFRTEVTEILNPDGTLTAAAGAYGGMKTGEARAKIIEDLKPWIEKIVPLKHAVNVHERCETDIEILPTYQWFIKYPSKEVMLAAGAALKWHPEHMKNRYDNWVRGLKWDWCISRQRYFGIPFPVWYCKDCGEIILADINKLPVDPLVDRPGKKCKCGSLDVEPEKDVMDTWATSSLTPQITRELMKDTPAYNKFFPMSLRPQAHDIISFWLFNTTIKSLLHQGKPAWHNVMISGWALDPQGRKMSKSKGNTIIPQEMAKKYCADALRFWAASSNLGEDLPFQEKELVTGMKTITKLWNAAKFVASSTEGAVAKPDALHPADAWLLTKLSKAVNASTEAFENYEYSKAKIETDLFFWRVFTDYYIEIVKDRIYNPGNYSKQDADSAKYTLRTAMLAVLKLFAPIMPHITEEIYRIIFTMKETIHKSGWPKMDYNYDKEEIEGDEIVKAIDYIRKYKSDNKLAMNAPLKEVIIGQKLSAPMADALKATMKIEKITFFEGRDPTEIVQ